MSASTESLDPAAVEELARQSPAWFAHLASRGKWGPAEHLVALAEKLAAVERGEIKRLAVFMPPRMGKSELISCYAPAWFLGRNPDKRVMLASATAKLASIFGRRVRDEIEEWGPRVFGVHVRGDSKAADRWDLEGHNGGMVTAGVGGQLTGLGADLLVIDDPLKDAAEAMSEVVRANQWEWWQSTARPRLHPGAGVVLVQTRWHEDDLAGRLLRDAREGGDAWEVLSLPAIAGTEDALGRDPGEPLWPERWQGEDPDFYAKTQRALGPYFWSALYQQTPTPDEGGIFSKESFRYFTVEGDRVTLRQPDGSVRTWAASECRKSTYADLAVSTKETADWTVATEVWVTPEREMLINRVTRDRIPGPDQPEFFQRHVVGTLKVEAIGYQTSLLQQLQLAGVPAEPVYPDKDKVTRASAAGALYRAGRIYHLAGADWLPDFELELLTFPASTHDDMVDTIAYAARDLPTLEISSRRSRRSLVRPLTAGLMSEQL